MPDSKGVTRAPIQCKNRLLSRSRRPLVMGILNVTPDSFSDGGQHLDPDTARARAFSMVREGVDIIDVGGESTRPGAAAVAPDEEMRRVMPVIEALAGQLDVPLSIDTRRPGVARAALQAGCEIVNDVTACGDAEMLGVVADSGAGIILMHMLGEPQSMQVNPSYEDVVGEITTYLSGRARALRAAGVEGNRIVIDPGIGFGKRFRDNLDLLRGISAFQETGYPVMIGASRKRFLGELLGAEANERLPGSLAVVARCYQCQVDMVRVHDVKETVALLRVLDAMESPGDYEADW